MFASTVPISDNFEGLKSLKTQFAMMLLERPDDPYAVACDLFGADRGKALQASAEWPSDPHVKAEMDRLTQERGALAFLPDKATVCRKIFNIAEAAKTDGERLRAYDLYAELMDMKPKTSSSSNGGTTVFAGNRVMVVTDHGTDDQWALKAESQQARLLAMADEDLNATDE